jgi:hypothetical protein
MGILITGENGLLGRHLIPVQRMIAEDHLPAVIIRRGTFFGPGDHLHFGAMAERLRTWRGILVGNGDSFMPCYLRHGVTAPEQVTRHAQAAPASSDLAERVAI